MNQTQYAEIPQVAGATPAWAPGGHGMSWLALHGSVALEWEHSRQGADRERLGICFDKVQTTTWIHWVAIGIHPGGLAAQKNAQLALCGRPQ